MKKISILLFCLSLFTLAKAQIAGDTIVVNTFNYGSTTRDSLIAFPDLPGVTYEKILMKYNMRCKNGLVSNGSNTNLGCGEWDYTCNTYIIDSSRIDSAKATHPSHILPGFSGTTFTYTNQPTYTYYQYNQQNVVNTATISEVTGTVGSGSSVSDHPFNTQLKESKSQFLWTASEITGSGLSAGNMTSIRVNVNNLGSAIQFLKIRMKHTNKTVLTDDSPDLTGFTEVYFLNTTLVNGVNQFNFYNPFNWNGTDNIIVEFSFSQATVGTSTSLSADLTSVNTGLITTAPDYHYEFSGANFFDLNNTNYNFTDKISIGFWSNGNPNKLPANTSIAYATNTANHRQVNIHLPWSNSRIYWDCGSGGNFDRIDNAATTPDIEGQWNYWTFTKNSTTGEMKIFLNGNLWHSGTNKILPIIINSFKLGNSISNDIPFFGKMDEFSLWNEELTQADIQSWMHRDIQASHPKFANLLAYYKFNEGSGNLVNCNITTANTNIPNPIWYAYKGKDKFKGFSVTNTRPTVTFVQGVYTQTTNTIVLTDSVMNIPQTVYSFSTNGTVITPVDTNAYYPSGWVYVYNGDNGNLIDSVAVVTTGTINVTPLVYYNFSPSRYQIMSFVTPYGINLDLGPAGKTWTFDVTDFTPFLKGNKRIKMEGGGEWQENMDIKFLFIVGTPPRNVKDIKNIWKVENAGYPNILNDTKFEPRTLTLDASAASHKVRTAITGHGQEGEFIPRQHYLDINGGAPEFTWDVWKGCGENPVYPQGGTWIYDRAGWCPGMATDTKEVVIDSFAAPGSTVTFDYGLDPATNGSSNYWVSSQLVSYGPANFSVDAAIVDIKNPSKKIEYARTNSICADPIVVIQNTGSTPLTSLTINYWVNNYLFWRTYNWTGNLKFMETAEIKINSNDVLWNGLDSVNNVFHAELANPNGVADAYSYNNKMSSPFDLTGIVPSDFYIYYRSNSFAAETDYKVLDENDNVIFSRSGMANNTIYRDTLHLSMGCYKFVMTDTDNDGISFWANNDGAGFLRFMRTTGQQVKIFNPDFGHSIVYNFTVDYPVSYEDIFDRENMAVYPNPATHSFTVEMKSILEKDIAVYNALGQKMAWKAQKSLDKIELDATLWPRGMYYVVIKDKQGHSKTAKVVLE